MNGINIQAISKPEIKVLPGIADKYLESAVHTLHRTLVSISNKFATF